MEELDDGEEMDKTPLLKPQPRPLTVPRKHFDLFDVRSKFVSTIRISAKKLHEKLTLSEDQKLSGQFDILNVSLSNSKISISSLVKFSSVWINVLVRTNEPISFGVYHKSIRRSLMTMARAHREIRRIALAYQPEEKKLIILDGRSEMCIKTVPCTSVSNAIVKKRKRRSNKIKETLSIKENQEGTETVVDNNAHRVLEGASTTSIDPSVPPGFEMHNNFTGLEETN